MTKQPIGSVLSGEFAHELWTKGEVYLYSYNRGKRSFRLKLILRGTKYYCTDINDGENYRPFDFSGLLHTMNDKIYDTVVFTNCWYAYAYENSLKQEARK